MCAKGKFLFSVQFNHSVVSDSLQPHGLQQARPPCPSPAPSLLKLMFIESVIPSNYFILCCSLFLPPSIFLSIRVFSNESTLRMRWPNYWSFSFSFFTLLVGAQTWITVILDGLPWKHTAINLSFLRLHPNTAFPTHLLTMIATPFLLRDSCPQ